MAMAYDMLQKQYEEMVRNQSWMVPAPVPSQWPAAGASIGVPIGRFPLKYDDNHLMAMLASRMCWDCEPNNKQFSFLAAHKIDEKVVVFIAAGGKGLVLEDELHLFPSDALVTQLRLLEPK